MARPKRISQIAADLEKQMRQAFLDAVQDLRDGAQIGRLIEALERGDIDGAIRALNLDAVVFDRMAEQLRTAANGAGNATIAALPALVDPDGFRIVARFGGSNERAERLLREHSAGLVQIMFEEQRDNVRRIVTAGQMVNQHPRRTGLDIVGRIGTNGRRQGGVIGLTTQQTDYVIQARADLISGDPARLRHFRTRQARDKGFDSILRDVEARGWTDAMARYNRRNGTDLSPAQMQDRIAGRYSDILLRKRGETIARTETGWAMARGQDEAMQQQIDGGNIRSDQITRVWDSSGNDGRTRDSHLDMDGQTRPWGEPFTTPDNHLMMHPLDGSMGAPASETINCRCVMRIDVDRLG